MNFAQTLKTLRTQKHLTQKQLAAHLHLSRSTVAGYETKNHQPDFETLQKLARYFDVSIDFLISGEAFATLQSVNEGKMGENALALEMAGIYQQLSLASKQEALKYLKFLQKKDLL